MLLLQENSKYAYDVGLPKGEPLSVKGGTMEIERKYLIEYPDIAWLESNPNCQRVEIIQTYLKCKSGDEIRLRQRGINGNYIYFKTIKRKLSGLKRVEIESRLSKEEYLEYVKKTIDGNDKGDRRLLSVWYLVAFIILIIIGKL